MIVYGGYITNGSIVDDMLSFDLVTHFWSRV